MEKGKEREEEGKEIKDKKRQRETTRDKKRRRQIRRKVLTAAIMTSSVSRTYSTHCSYVST